MLPQPLPLPDDATVRQRAADVVALDGPRFLVRTGATAMVAERAVSCLVEPEVGDRVLLASEDDGDHYVLAVLRRPSGGAVSLSTSGDVTLKAPSGRVDVVGRDGVTLASPAEVSVVAEDVQLTGTRGTLALEELSVVGAVVEAHVSTVRAVASSVDAVLDRVVQRVKHAFRFVEETDHLTAKDVEMNASATLSVQAHDAVVHAEQLVKIDGEQIHVG